MSTGATLCPPARTGCASSSPTTAGDSARGTASLFVDGDKVGQGRVDGTVPMLFSGDETADVGTDFASPVADDYPDDTRFTGRINWVQLDIGADDHDHLISTEERLRIAMTRQ